MGSNESVKWGVHENLCWKTSTREKLLGGTWPQLILVLQQDPRHGDSPAQGHLKIPHFKKLLQKLWARTFLTHAKMISSWSIRRLRGQRPAPDPRGSYSTRILNTRLDPNPTVQWRQRSPSSTAIAHQPFVANWWLWPLWKKDWLACVIQWCALK